MTDQSFQQVDVFSSEPLTGGPLAVVIGADDLCDRQMVDFATWTNLLDKRPNSSRNPPPATLLPMTKLGKIEESIAALFDAELKRFAASSTPKASDPSTARLPAL